METYGNVISCNISLNKNKQSNGYGYVEFETEEECQKVLDSKREIQKQIGDQNFIIEPFNKPVNKHNCIYVTNIDSTVEDIDIITYFSKFGEIEKKDKKIKCFFRLEQTLKKKNGFITYINEEDATKALNSPTENVLGKDIHIELYKSKKEKAQEKEENLTSLYKNYNLKIKFKKRNKVTRKSISNYFKGCGKIYSIYIQMNK
ncbi:RNA recognition motif domain containing protein [Entamoeba histolytica]|uniref:RNA recognition motif domain containing protein n=2 Tax=Entamoeba histolytica TaxID=5759 RepID=B1N2K4_ENTH1|nr:RNA recognition motif domain containing protein [Entamoeba histolytica HM-1:IMSS]EDS89799.1 RNA recognition motif domain containing protein [Entamoeba histolytica HM-1:IMSS]GAT92153.1 RNA recognition motif domain containing protein [Entamoeba histolytica]|eukprot:XP_001913420.1 RNA recognition motif domain containing protein [Entamoeba histolytica HM-1:IMSS]